MFKISYLTSNRFGVAEVRDPDPDKDGRHVTVFFFRDETRQDASLAHPEVALTTHRRRLLR